jgi:hypothetical protein
METNNAVKGIHLPSFSWKLLLYLLPVPLSLFIFIFLKKCRYIAREEKILSKFLKKVRKKYPEADFGPSTGLLDLSEITGRVDVRRFADIYCRAVYHDRKLSDSEYAELRKLIDII